MRFGRWQTVGDARERVEEIDDGGQAVVPQLQGPDAGCVSRRSLESRAEVSAVRLSIARAGVKVGVTTKEDRRGIGWGDGRSVAGGFLRRHGAPLEATGWCAASGHLLLER